MNILNTLHCILLFQRECNYTKWKDKRNISVTVLISTILLSSPWSITSLSTKSSGYTKVWVWKLWIERSRILNYSCINGKDGDGGYWNKNNVISWKCAIVSYNLIYISYECTSHRSSLLSVQSALPKKRSQRQSTEPSLPVSTKNISCLWPIDIFIKMSYLLYFNVTLSYSVWHFQPLLHLPEVCNDITTTGPP